LSWEEILDIFYKHITRQSTVRTKNYVFRIIYRLFQVKSLGELKFLLWNYFGFLKIFIRNVLKKSLNSKNKAKDDRIQS